MDAKATLTNLNAALAAPANAAPAPAVKPAPNRSFAATLAREQPPAHEAPRPESRPQAPGAGTANGDVNGSPPTGPAQDVARSTSDPAAGPRPTAGAKRPARAKGSGGDDSPPDGNTLPVWLTAPTSSATPAAEPAAATAAAVAAAAAAMNGTPAPAAADATAAKTGAAVEATAASAPASTAPAVTSLGTDARADTGRAPHEAAQPTFEAAAAALAAASGADDGDDDGAASAAKPGPAAASAATASPPARAEAGLALARLAAAPETTPSAPTPAAASVEASRVVATVIRPSGEPVTSASRAPSASGVRASGSAVENAPTPARAQDTPPVAPELRRAVTAMQAIDVKTEAVEATAKAPAAADPGSVATVAPTLERGSVAATPATVQVAAPVGSADWAHELSDRVSVLVDQNLTHAQIKLAPADLGPIEVRIAVTDGQANVSFTTHSHVTSEALQAAAPLLRDALGAQGYASVNVDVAQHQFRERTPQQSRYEPEPGPGAAPAATGVSAVSRPSPGTAALRLDAYA